MTTAATDLHSEEKLTRLAADIALDGFGGPGSEEFGVEPAFAALGRAGSELWFDTGDKAAARKVWTREMRGLTTNNTLVNQVIQTGALDETIGQIGSRLKDSYPGMDAKSRVIEAAFILNARLGLGLVEAFSSKVSVELHPDLGYDWQTTVVFGRRYYEICPSHFIIKVPMTPDGFIAVRKLSGLGIPVNFTLGFSVRQNYFAALFSRPHYVNIFLGRLGVLVKDNGLGTGDNIGEHVTLASQEAMEALRVERGVTTRQIAASLRAGNQVADLAGVDVQTIPPKVAREYLDAGYDLHTIERRFSSEFPVSFENGAARYLSVLWEVAPEFKQFSDEAVRSEASITSGSDILNIAESCGVSGFFRRWSPGEQSEIRQGGKIPDFGRWKGVAQVDDLMSQAALQSFISDQGELDDRVGRLIT